MTLAEGPERLVAIPAGTTLVSSRWLNLDLGGADRDFTVPGFDLYGGTSGCEERRVELSRSRPASTSSSSCRGGSRGRSSWWSPTSRCR